MRTSDKYMIVVFAVFMICMAPVAYYNTNAWSDTGHVNWIGQKQFNGNVGKGQQQWSTPFSVMTNSHGVFNFTTIHPVSGPFLCIQGTEVSPTLGILVGVTENNYGCVTVAIDP